jgi:tetratricopeptide (TPR) repeat protein
VASPSQTSELLRRSLLALGCFAVVLFFFSPAWSAFARWSHVPEMAFQIEVRRGVSVLEQVAHPGTPVTDSLHSAIQWRLLFPVIGHVLALPPVIFFALADLGCVALLGFVITLLRRAQVGWWECALAAVTLGAASWCFTSTGWLGYFDAWLALGLLLAAFAENRWTLWAACLWTPWVDERFALAAPLALLCRYLWLAAGAAGFNARRDALVPSALLAAFLAVRLGVLPRFSAAGATLGGYFDGKSFLDASASRLALGVWEGLRAAWLFVVAAVVLLRPRPAQALALGAATLGVVGIGLATAQDYSRSMTIVLPVAVLGLLLAGRANAPWRPRALRLAAVAALVLPAHHVINNRVDPIFYFYHELAAFENPPPGARPEFYELRAIHAMERGDFGSAETDLTLAIKLAPNPAAPAKQRGILRASQRRWAEAEADFALLAEREPKNPDAWFMHAQARFALGDPVRAQADIDRARALAPADWVTRPDVARFLAKLNAR